MQNINIFGEIGTEVTADGIRNALSALRADDPIVVTINSSGGSVQDGVAIFNLLKAWKAEVTVDIVGWALSAASVIAMAGNKIRMAPTALMMIHAPWVDTAGNASELRSMAQTLDLVQETLIKAYARSGQSETSIRAWLAKDTWIDAEQAISLGLADEVLVEAQASAPLDIQAALRRFAIPQEFQQRINAMPHSTPSIRSQADTDQIVASYRSITRRNSNPDLESVFLESLRDPSTTPKAFGERVLVVLGRGSEPIAGQYMPGNTHGSDRHLADFKAAATDVLLERAGIPVANPHPASRDISRLSIVSMAERVLSMAGVSTRDKTATEIIQAAMSTSDFPELLSNVTGKSLRAGYESAPATHAVWTGEREVRDFKPQSLLALGEAPSMEKVLEYGEYKFGYFGESAESFSVETFGKLVQISRQALINDDLAAFTRIPQSFGASARRIEADLVYKKLLSNPVLKDGIALFHANHGNLASAGAALTVEALGAARAAMRQQKGTSSLDYIDPQPAFLITPVALETTSEQLLASLSDPAKQNSGTNNPEWIRRLTLVSDPRLDAVDNKAWYLAANPNQIDTIIRAYLQGEGRPYVEENDEFKRDVISYKSRLDLGVGVIDFRGLYKNPGA